MNLKDKLKQLPSSPGVYFMKDSRQNIIYIGKSKNLKNRVQSYFQKAKNHSPKIEKLVHTIRDFDYVVTDTEFEALLLECKLIKEQQPLFNRMMKNPQVYCYIEISYNEEIPRIKVVNTIEGNHHLYFGPYPNRNRVEKAIQGLKEYLQIDCCHQSHQGKACLNYSLGTCMGICLGEENMKKKYLQAINRMTSLLSLTDEGLLKDIESKMMQASESFDFETAAKYRDYFEGVKSILQKEKVIAFAKSNKKVAIIEPLDEHIFKLFLIEGDQVLFGKKYDWESYDSIQNELTILQSDSSPENIQKNEIDEAQIIYSFVQRAKTCTLIEGSWIDLTDDLINRLIEKAVNSRIEV